MARPLSDERRNAILEAAMVLIAEQGIGASTADIAKRAGVPSGSVFTYFPTKTDLLNALYLELKTDLTTLVSAGMPKGDAKAKLRHLWSVWTQWGAKNPLKRKALSQLGVSDQISDETRQATMKMAAAFIDLISEVSARGALADAPATYVRAMYESTIYTTMDSMIANPKQAKKISEAGFEALWRMLT